MRPEDESEITGLAVVIGADEDVEPGVQAGAYTIAEPIGRGGCGTVYLATHTSDGARAAVKVLHSELAMDPLAVERFLREVRTVDKIKHPNIVEIYELGRLPDERPYFAMELLEGMNLRRLLQSEGRLSTIETFELVEQICAALETVHGIGVVHRDLKAENVIVDSQRRVKLVDFGLAKLVAADPAAPGLTTTRQIVGTLVAMAPEQLRSEPVDARTDIYALGALVYNMLTGVPPFRGSPEDVARMHLESPPRPPSALVILPPAIDAIVLRCLEKSPAGRFQTVQSFMAAFRAAVFGQAAPTRARIGVGVLVRATAAADSDDALADAAMALDLAEAQLRGAGFQIAVQTSSEVMGAQVAPGAPTEELQARRRAIALAHQIYANLETSAGPAVRVSVTVHSNEVDVRLDGEEIIGGPLLEIGAWSPAHHGVSVTPRAWDPLESTCRHASLSIL